MNELQKLAIEAGRAILKSGIAVLVLFIVSGATAFLFFHEKKENKVALDELKKELKLEIQEVRNDLKECERERKAQSEKIAELSTLLTATSRRRN